MTEAVVDPAATEQKPEENPNPIDFRDEEKVQRYLKRKTKRGNVSDDEDEEYSQGEAKMVKQDPKYGEKDLYKKILQLKHKKFDDEESNENDTTKEKENSDENKENVDENMIKTDENQNKEKEIVLCI